MRDQDALHGAVGFEQLSQFLLGGLEVQIADVYVLHTCDESTAKAALGAGRLLFAFIGVLEGVAGKCSASDVKGAADFSICLNGK